MPVIAAPTPYVWIIGRTQTNGPADYPAVHQVQDGYRITPLGVTPEHVTDADYDTTTEPVRVVNGMAALGLFAYAAELLAVNPPHPTDFSVLARIAHLGIEAGKPFDASRFSTEQQRHIEAGWAAALNDMKTSRPSLGTIVNRWSILTTTVGVWGNAYLTRAAVALTGLGINPAEDATYPNLTTDADGDPITGERDYLLPFDAGQLPPTAAFWSVTAYDAEGYQVANDINRFAIGDRDPLTFNADGSLDLYLQHTNPGPQRESNWLPTPPGPVAVTLRIYAPNREVLDGRWRPPPVRKA